MSVFNNECFTINGNSNGAKSASTGMLCTMVENKESCMGVCLCFCVFPGMHEWVCVSVYLYVRIYTCMCVCGIMLNQGYLGHDYVLWG